MVSNQPAASKFPQVEQDEAQGSLAALYEDVHATLRVPWVAFAIRVLSGMFPGFVEGAWQAARPSMATLHAERCADEIRRAAILPGASPPDPKPRLLEMGWSDEKIAHVNGLLDALNYGNPKYLVLLTAWEEAFNGRPAGGQTDLAPELARPIPYGLPAGMKKMHLVDYDEASAEVLSLWQRAMNIHLHHGPASDYRVLAAYPDFLRVAMDEIIEPVVRTPVYEEAAIRIRAIARRGVAGFPTPGGVSREELQSRLSPTQIASLTALLFMKTRFIADITIDVIRLKQAFEGPSSAGESKFPVPA